jgi:hypothetical protein
MTNYEEIRDKIRTGDIILFSGKSAISLSIKLMVQSKWSYIGMALRLPQVDTIFIWEASPLLKLEDAIEGRSYRAVRLVELGDRLNNYRGDISIRHLIGIDIDENMEMKKHLINFRKEIRHRPYEKVKLDLMREALGSPLDETRGDFAHFFSSELIAEAYQRIGLLDGPPKGLAANEYTTKDFSEAKELPLLQAASLSIEVPLTT